jgi:hypothetical protein
MRIPVSARLTSSMRRLKSLCSEFPCFELLAHGARLRYGIIARDEKESYFLELSRDSIVLEVHSHVSPMYLMQKAMIKLLSIIALLRTEYSMEITSIFPYLISQMASNNMAYYLGNMENPVRHSSSDTILASRILNLHSRNAALESELESAKERYDSILSAIIRLEGQNSHASLGSIAQKYQVGRPELERAVERLSLSGFTIINSGKDIFSVVGH